MVEYQFWIHDIYQKYIISSSVGSESMWPTISGTDGRAPVSDLRYLPEVHHFIIRYKCYNIYYRRGSSVMQNIPEGIVNERFQRRRSPVMQNIPEGVVNGRFQRSS